MIICSDSFPLTLVNKTMILLRHVITTLLRAEKRKIVPHDVNFQLSFSVDILFFFFSLSFISFSHISPKIKVKPKLLLTSNIYHFLVCRCLSAKTQKDLGQEKYLNFQVSSDNRISSFLVYCRNFHSS